MREKQFSLENTSISPEAIAALPHFWEVTLRPGEWRQSKPQTDTVKLSFAHTNEHPAAGHHVSALNLHYASFFCAWRTFWYYCYYYHDCYDITWKDRTERTERSVPEEIECRATVLCAAAKSVSTIGDLHNFWKHFFAIHVFCLSIHVFCLSIHFFCLPIDVVCLSIDVLCLSIHVFACPLTFFVCPFTFFACPFTFFACPLTFFACPLQKFFCCLSLTGLFAVNHSQVSISTFGVTQGVICVCTWN